jgi:hypothetical protein
VATDVVVVAVGSVIKLVVVEEVPVTTVVARVTPRKLEAKSRLCPAEQTFPDGATEQAMIEIK